MRSYGVLPKLGHIEKGGGLPLWRGTESLQTAPRRLTLDVPNCVSVHFLGMQKGNLVVFCFKNDESLHA